ncbi:MAG: T9SS type A sorting domain-containing protein, partial [Bacteroidota bacterium]
SEDLFIDSSYTLTLVQGGNFAPAVSWGIWVDFNQDGDFEDGNEYIFESAPTSDSAVTTQLNLSPLTNIGRTRMRVAVKYISGANDPLVPCEVIGTGEYEDYCLNFLPPCKAPVNFDALYDSASAAVFLQWQSEFYSDTFAVQYKFLDDTNWITLPGNNFDFYQLADSLLNSCTPYEFRALTVCGDSLSTASKADTILTPCITNLEDRLAKEVVLMPNPTQGTWFVQAPVRIESVEVFNLVGQQILTRIGSQERMQVRMPAVEAGVYLVRIQTAKGSLVKRLLYQP